MWVEVWRIPRVSPVERDSSPTRTLGELPSETEVSSNARLTRRFLQITDGSILPNYCPTKKLTDAQELERLLPLTETQMQLILGTMLGDASMVFLTQHPRYRCNHGSKQTEYVLHKAKILQNYVNTPPALCENLGYGKESCVFSTLTTPILEFIRKLCYSEEDSKYTKTVTIEWLNKLTWEGIAYWYMDDGSLFTKANGLILHTQGFTQEQVELIARWLTEKGVTAKSQRVRRKQKVYHIVRLSKESAVTFLNYTRPYMIPSLAYKFTMVLKECSICQAILIDGRANTCSNPKCRASVHRIVCQNYLTRHKDSLEFQKMRLENSQRANAVRNKRLQTDEDYKAHIQAQWRAKTARDAARAKEDLEFASHKKEMSRLEKQRAKERRENDPVLMEKQRAQWVASNARKKAKKMALKLKISST